MTGVGQHRLRFTQNRIWTNMNKRLLNHGGDLYIILREIPKHHMENIKKGTVGEAVALWKEYTEADRVLQNKEHYLFCQKVEEAQIVE